MKSFNCFNFGINQTIGDYVVAPALTAARWGVLATEWYVQTFFSAQAQARYEVAGRWVWQVAAFTFGLGVVARRAVQAWVNEEVALALPLPKLQAEYFVTVELGFSEADQELNASLEEALENCTTDEEVKAAIADDLAFWDAYVAELAADGAIVDGDNLPGMRDKSDYMGGETDYRPAQAAAMQPSAATLRIPMADLLETDQADRLTELEAMTLAQLKPIADKHNLQTRKVRKPLLIDRIIKAEGFEV